jgi:hypothetical protein
MARLRHFLIKGTAQSEAYVATSGGSPDFRQGGEDAEHQLAAWRCGIDAGTVAGERLAYHVEAGTDLLGDLLVDVIPAFAGTGSMAASSAIACNAAQPPPGGSASPTSHRVSGARSR